MALENGMGSNGAPYEYVAELPKTAALRLKKLGFVALYAAWVIAFVAIGAIVKIIVPLLAFIPLSTWAIVFFTWKYTQVSYEYSFFQGELTVKRVLGSSRKKKEIVKVRIKDITALHACDGSQEEKVREFAATNVIFTVSLESSKENMVALWTNEKNEKTALYFEVDDHAKRIIRYYNSSLSKSE